MKFRIRWSSNLHGSRDLFIFLDETDSSLPLHYYHVRLQIGLFHFPAYPAARLSSSISFYLQAPQHFHRKRE